MAIAFRGIASGGAINGGNVTLNLAAPSAGSAPVVGDVVLIIAGSFSRGANEARIGNALGYTELINDFSTLDEHYRVAWKYFVAGETGPVVEGSTNAADATGATAIWFSGANFPSPFAATSTIAFNNASTNPNPPAITPTADNCMIVALAASSAVDAATGTVTNYTTQASNQSTSDTNSISTSAAYRLLSGGSGVSEDPAAFSAWLTGEWTAVTIALAPRLFSVTATLKGAGALSGNALVQSPALATLGGLGVLSVDARVRSPAAATFAGSGALSVNVVGGSAGAQAGQSESNIFVINYSWPSAPPQFRYLYVQAPALDTVSIWAGQATFVGAGSLSASARLNEAAAATLQGSGSLSVAATQAMAAQASFAGSGTLSADVRQGKSAAATFGGTGSLSAAAGQGMAVSAQFVGTGSLSAYANLRMVVQATLQGSGSLSALAVIPGAAVTVETNTSFLGVFTPTSYQLFAGLRQSADARIPVQPIEAIFAGAGGLSALAGVVSAVTQAGQSKSNIFVINYYWPRAPIGAQYNLYLQPARDVAVAGPTQWAGQATFTGAGSLSALTTQQMAVLATFSGAGTLRVDAQNAKPVTATFAGAGSLAAYVTSQMVASAIFGGVGSLSADARVSGAVNAWSGEATFNGAGGLTVTARLNEAAAATFGGVGSLAAFANLRMGAAATFNGVGSLSVDLQKLAESIAATFAGIGGLSGRAQLAMASSAVFGGLGTLSVTMQAQYALGIRFTGTGVLIASLTEINTAQARFNGAGALSADVGQVRAGTTVWTGQARFDGRGTLSVDSNVVPFVPGPTYDFPIEHALDSDYGIRGSKLRRGRLVIGRR